ncbi:glycosyltransferase [Nocardioides astragali]|uniref:Glycosyltransferase n=1 Tax=Nocardioides astragali TaxID=1776736 RepID=A0ABW2NBN7_9ACTN|nr:glycosyltransferase [Nocardioides astragali]
MFEVRLAPVGLDRLAQLLASERARRLEAAALRAQEQLRGRVVWNVNATATGGGVAEMLQVLVAYGRGAGVDTRWLVLDGDPEFFTITKRLHNFLHGSSGDEGSLDDRARSHYEQVLARNLDELLQRVHPQDIVILHDPQTAGLVPGLVAAGAHVAWRCHIGRDTANELHDLGWAFLRPYIMAAHAFIFSRREYVPAWVRDDLVWVVPPSLDPFSAKNADLDPEVVSTTLHVAGLVSTSSPTSVTEFDRRREGHGRVRHRDSLIIDGPPVPGDARVVLQVSRWDRLKDMEGVLRGFADNLSGLPDDAHLVLAGPDVTGVTDDPEGGEVLASCLELRVSMDTSIRRRIHLTALPMDDVDENAHLVNALQRHASVVVQKSLVEGFGLTVTEPMWKSRPVVASAVGGIQDQIDHGVNGLLLDDPYDLDGMVKGVDTLLRDPETAQQLGERAHRTVLDRFLGDRHLLQYGELFASMIEA